MTAIRRSIVAEKATIERLIAAEVLKERNSGKRLQRSLRRTSERHGGIDNERRSDQRNSNDKSEDIG